MKDKWSWISCGIIISGLLFVYAGFGSIEAETLSNLAGGFIALFGLVMALIGGMLLKINELED